MLTFCPSLLYEIALHFRRIPFRNRVAVIQMYAYVMESLTDGCVLIIDCLKYGENKLRVVRLYRCSINSTG